MYDVYITQTSTNTVTRVIEGVITVGPKSIIVHSLGLFVINITKERGNGLELIRLVV